MRAIAMRLLPGLAIACLSCGSTSQGTDPIAATVAQSATVANGSVSPSSAFSREVCSGFTPTYIPGSGLTTLLPAGAQRVEAFGTTDAGPIHASQGATYLVNGVEVTIGRTWIDPTQGQPTVFVQAASPELGECVKAGTTYSRADDEADS